MNLRLEACRRCPVQCQLENDFNNLKKTALTGTSTQEIRQKTSVYFLKANRNNCPPDEVRRIRDAALTEINPKLVQRFREFNLSSGSYESASFPIGFQNGIQKR